MDIQNKESSEFVEALKGLGVIASMWLGYIDGSDAAPGAYVISVGRVLRASPPKEVRQRASERIVQLLSEEEGRRNVRLALSYPDDLCREGIQAARAGTLKGESLLGLLEGRNDLESLYVVINWALVVDASLADVPDFVRLVEEIAAIIKRTDSRIDFEIPLDALRATSDSLRSREYAHLCVLAKEEPGKWWLAPFFLLAMQDACKKKQ